MAILTRPFADIFLRTTVHPFANKYNKRIVHESQIKLNKTPHTL